MYNLDTIEPKRVFHFFKEISAIPHGSYNTKEISEYCVEFARKNNLEYYKDEHDNVVIYKPATEGYENVAPVIIQGHTDMVCEKEPAVDFDFLKDGLKLKVEGDFLRATGTTLGGDDGIAVAIGLALLEDNEHPHPALEVLFTSDEEVGLLGADKFDTSKLSGKYFINLDSEEESTLTCGCAGGLRMDATIPVSREAADGMEYNISLTSFLGGHSGIEIDKWHINPVILSGRLLSDLSEKAPFKLVSLNGGNKDNAIPRETYCTVLVAKEDVETFERAFEEEKITLIDEFSSMEPNMEVKLDKKEEKEAFVLTSVCYQDVLYFLAMTPVGVQAMSGDIAGLVETSLNLGIFDLKENEIKVSYALRSSKNTARVALEKKMQRFFARFEGSSFSRRGEYPAWEYRKESKLRDLCTKVYEKRYGKEMKVQAIHAGLECGIFSERMKDLDCISIGADVFDVHTPKEKLSISSTKRTYEYLLEVLKMSKDCL